ncbi:MAG: ATP-binding protein [Candidatus Nomurabacteria bacterium]|nr:ATP-binding protein [Candidatus Nomurabacteria bacterium]
MLSHFINIQYCYTYLIDQTPVSLLLYSHIPTAILALFFGIFIFLKNRSQQGFALLMICISFALWCLFDLSSWFSFIGSGNTMLAWSLLDLISLIMFFFSYYFLYTFITEKDFPIWQWFVGFILILPTAVWTLLGKNLPNYDSNNCQAIENTKITGYLFYILGLFIIISSVFSIYQYMKNKENFEKRKKILLVGSGIILFLIFFFSALLAVNLLANSDSSGYVYNYEIYGLFGMPILLIFLGYLVIKFKAFNVKLISAQALIFALITLIGSQFLFITSTVNFILNGVTFIGVVIFGIFLIESVKKEVRQKEYLEKLTIELNDSKMRLEDTNIKLESANDKLQSLDKLKTEFLSLASHQLRSPLTAITGYTSMLLDGSFGKMDDKQKEAIDRVYQSSRHLSTTVEDLLNVTKIEQGGMQYVMADFDFEKAAQDLAKDLSVTAEKKGLKLTFKTDKKSPYTVKGDMEKIRQVILNFIDNSIKYTKKGSIHVLISKDEDKKKIRLSITDTGMGMTPEIKAKLFQKFSRAEGAKMNAGGSGLGLYLAKKIIEEGHHGAVGVDSDGTDLGSTFWMELDEATN